MMLLATACDPFGGGGDFPPQPIATTGAIPSDEDGGDDGVDESGDPEPEPPEGHSPCQMIAIELGIELEEEVTFAPLWEPGEYRKTIAFVEGMVGPKWLFEEKPDGPGEPYELDRKSHNGHVWWDQHQGEGEGYVADLGEHIAWTQVTDCESIVGPDACISQLGDVWEPLNSLNGVIDIESNNSSIAYGYYDDSAAPGERRLAWYLIGKHQFIGRVYESVISVPILIGGVSSVPDVAYLTDWGYDWIPASGVCRRVGVQ